MLGSVAVSVRELLSPHHCEICGIYTGTRSRRMEYVCDGCLDSLASPPSPNELMARLSKNFTIDDLSITSVFSLVAAEQSAPVMEILYSLKYRGISRIGLEFGREIGKTLKHFGIDDYEVIIPVPIHHARRRERGYNQSEHIGYGISQVLGIKLESNVLIRSRYTVSQTKLSANERKVNVMGVFSGGRNKSMILNKKVLLVDDVFTTGTTLNSCATALLELGALRVDVATLAAAV